MLLLPFCWWIKITIFFGPERPKWHLQLPVLKTSASVVIFVYWIVAKPKLTQRIRLIVGVTTKIAMTVICFVTHFCFGNRCCHFVTIFERLSFNKFNSRNSICELSHFFNFLPTSSFKNKRILLNPPCCGDFYTSFVILLCVVSSY